MLIAYLVVVSVGTLLAGIGLFSVAGITAALLLPPPYHPDHRRPVSAGRPDRPPARRVRQIGFPQGHRGTSVTLLGVLFFVGAMAAAGMPPLSGFIGKLLLLQAAPPKEAVWLIWLWTIVLVGGLAALIALSRAGSILFWTKEGEMVAAQGQRLHLRLIAPVILLLMMSVVMTVFAAPITRYAEATAAQLLNAGQLYRSRAAQEEKP